MTNNILENYYEWICTLAFPETGERAAYSNLLGYLYARTFEWSIPLDENRYTDGIDLRFRYGYEYRISADDISMAFDGRPCSMLEMMIALSLRCEEHIMSNEIFGDRLSYWFKNMLNNLKLSDQKNNRYDEKFVEYRLSCFFAHAYEPTGEGGLFVVSNPRQDMRHVEIWYQMCWYLDSVLEKETY